MIQDDEFVWMTPQEKCPKCGSTELESEIAGHGPGIDCWYMQCKDCEYQWGEGVGEKYTTSEEQELESAKQ